MSKTILWVTDPWNTLAHSQDTTLRLHQEATNLGMPSYWSGSDVLFNPLRLDRFYAGTDSTTLVELEPSKIHQIHYRVDPPVDFNYLSLLEKIVRCVGDESRIFSPPSILRVQSEKVPPDALSHLTPLHFVVRDEAGLRNAFARFQDYPQIVSKPMNEAQSKGVKLWTTPKSLDQWVQIFVAETQNFSQPILLQEYLPGIHQGEIRMWFAGGKFIAALKKHPKTGDFKVLIDEGSKIEAYTLNTQEMNSAQEVGAVLKKQGVAMAAIDFIQTPQGSKISDYNITSPGLLVQLEQVHSRNFAREILGAINP